ncbi:MAG: M48 family metalloprotease [Gammaproteobacteria bacterium]|nr:M48 family metalloprotease [Gammaproteobacteria bacterium]
MKSVVIIALSMLMLSGCATISTVTATGTEKEIESEQALQARKAVESYFDRYDRLTSVSRPILAANADLCQEQTYHPGFTVLSRFEIPRRPKVYAEALEEQLNLRVHERDADEDDRFIVFSVAAGSPAGNSGLLRGDRIVSVEGEQVPLVASKRQFRKAQKRFRELVENQELSTWTMSVQRLTDQGWQTLELRIESELMCDCPVIFVDRDESLNAFADSKNIYITAGMLRFANDFELQLVVAHELAHVAEGHSDQQALNTAMGGLLGLLGDLALATHGISSNAATHLGAHAGQRAHSKDFEREADYISIYYLERAGIDSTKAPDFWRRIAANRGSTFAVYGGTHPTSSERFINLKATVEEIQSKRDAGLPLVPTRKEPRQISKN